MRRASPLLASSPAGRCRCAVDLAARSPSPGRPDPGPTPKDPTAHVALGIPFDDVQVRVDATITGAASTERYAQLHAAVEAHGPVQDIPVQDMLTGTVHVKSELTVG